MKNRFMPVALLALLLGAGTPALVSCSGNSEETTTDHHAATATAEEDIKVVHATYQTPDNFKAGLQRAMEHYLKLKDALVESNGQEGQQHATALSTALNETDAATLDGEAAQKWNELAGDLKSGAAAIAATSDLATQRGAFTKLSEQMIAAAEAFGAGSTVYRQYCPMANKNAGGSWLSSNSEIRNPYYGDAMLECGEVEAAIRDKE